MAKRQKSKKNRGAIGVVTDVDGILKRAEADRKAANQQHIEPYAPPWGWSTPNSSRPREAPDLAQRSAESYVTGNRPAPLRPISARERKAARAQAATSGKQQKRKKPA